MSIEIKLSKKRIPYEKAMFYLNKRVEEVKNGKFPDDDHTYSVSDKEYDKFLSLVEKRKQL